AYPVFLWYLVALVTAMAGLGVSMRGPRLVAFGMMLYFGLSHTRGLVMFILIVPIFLARPISLHAAWFRAAEGGDAQFARTPDPVLVFLQKRPFTLPAISLALAAVVTAYSWDKINIGPPKSITPSAAVEFIQRAGIAGNVFNSYSFGGYLIFVGIQTFVDGRTPPHADDFVRRYSNA